VHPDGVQLRFNWNAGLTWDPHEPGAIYLGSQFLHRSRDQGRSWEIRSPDLTTDDPAKQRAYESGGLTYDASGAEMHTTIISIGPSFLEEGVIWVGTDDGNVQLTRDGGATWENVRDNVPGLPEGIWIPDVQPSKHVAGRAYLVAEDHRRGDWTPRVWTTEDYGESWRSIASDGIGGFVHAIEEDPENPDLLFLGTEFGLRVSMDRGATWMPFTAGVPAVPIRDLQVHRRDGDLVLGTHGRAAIVVDDIRPLRELASTPEIHEQAVHAFGPPPAVRATIAEAIGYRSTGHAMQQAETRPEGALLTWWNGDEGQARVEITDASGRTVYTAEESARAGLNRTSWDLEPDGDKDDAFPGRIPVAPGTYTFTVSSGGASASAELRVVADPRVPFVASAHAAQVAAMIDYEQITSRVDEARDRIEEIDDRIGMVLETLDDDDEALRRQGEAVRDSIRLLLEDHFTGPECQGGCRGIVTASAVQAPGGRIAGDTGGPTENTRLMLEQARAAADTIVGDIDALVNGDVAAYRSALRAAGYTPFGETP
jgi:hypothetical protein